MSHQEEEPYQEVPKSRGWHVLLYPAYLSDASRPQHKDNADYHWKEAELTNHLWSKDAEFIVWRMFKDSKSGKVLAAYVTLKRNKAKAALEGNQDEAPFAAHTEFLFAGEDRPFVSLGWYAMEKMVALEAGAKAYLVHRPQVWD
jgi:hypothetical protein